MCVCAAARAQTPLWTLGAGGGGAAVAAVVARAEGVAEKVARAYDKWARTGGPEEDFVNTGRSGGERER